MKKIALLVASNPYDSTTYFAKGLAEGLKQLGAKIKLLSFTKENAYRCLDNLWDGDFDLTCSFSDLTFNQKIPICELTQIPHLSILVDPAIYFLHQTNSCYSSISYVDEEDQVLLNGFNFKKHFFLPHGSDPRYFKEVDGPRPYQAVFFGTCIDYEHVERSWDQKYPKAIGQALKLTVEKVFNLREQSLLFYLLESLEEKKVADNPFGIELLHHEIDQYIRGKDRIETLKALAHLEVTIFGSSSGVKGWKDYLPQFNIQDPVNFGKSIKIMQNAQLVINSSPRFSRAGHERIFYAALAGAQVLTNKNSFLSSLDLHFYEPGRWDLLKDFELTGPRLVLQQEVLKNHTWKNRAQKMMEILQF